MSAKIISKIVKKTNTYKKCNGKLGIQTKTNVLVMDTMLGTKSRNEGAIKVPHLGNLFKHMMLIIDMVIKSKQ